VLEGAADLLDWESDYDQVLDDSNPPFYEWFTGGELNASANCLDRHLDDRGDEVAIEWIGEPVDEDDRSYTYAELHREVNEFAAALRDRSGRRGGRRGDDVHADDSGAADRDAGVRPNRRPSVVFAGFSADALATRMNSAESEYLVTCDGYYRRGDPLDHLDKANQGLAGVEHDTTTVVVDRLGPNGDDFGHDLGDDQIDYGDLVADHEGAEVDPVGHARRRGHAVPDVHLGNDREAEGRETHDRGLSLVGIVDLAVGPRYQAG